MAIWGLCCVLAGAVFLAYSGASLAAGRGDFVMPLDDVYIHFQYARQLAAGQPYVYNPGLPPTSGATSFLYPYLLAVGDLLGFDGLRLGLWAMGLGAVALAVSTWLVVRLALFHAPVGLALGAGVAFALSGPVSWHFMSGMETGLAVTFTLGTLVAFAARRPLRCVMAAALLALIRPEGGLLALLAMVALFAQFRRQRRADPAWEPASAAWLLVPALAVAVQPIVNRALTHSWIASGNQSKSLFGMVPPYHDAILGRIIENTGRMAIELATGFSAREGWYYPFTLAMLALAGLVLLWRRHETRVVALLVIGWLVAGMVAIATLDTAFWHFKRYQMPLIALIFALAAWTIGLWSRRATLIRNGLAVLSLALALLTAGPFLHHFLLNADYVYRQPLQLARWLSANTLPDAVVAVHDTGLLRYVGDRTTIDIVGLTTPGAAEYWRNGPGSVAELLDALRPDLIASYGHGHGFGLGYLADTDLYAEPLVEIPLALDERFNVALAAGVQGIYRPDWTAADRAALPIQPVMAQYVGGNAVPADRLDVADLVSERAHHYRWSDAERLGGFPTDVYQLPYVDCAAPECVVMDGGRHINGEEIFEFQPGAVADGSDFVLITRLHPANAGTFDVYVGETRVATRWIPALPGAWLDVATRIPADLLAAPTRIRIVPQVPGGHYMPYHHWLYPARVDPLPEGEPLTAFQDGNILLFNPQLRLDDEGRLTLTLTWATPGGAEGDYKIFVHVLDEAGATVAQADVRPGGGALPPGNWLPGAFRDVIVVDLAHVSPGEYRVVMGLYHPETFERLMPSNGDEAGRVTVGQVEVSGDG